MTGRLAAVALAAAALAPAPPASAHVCVGDAVVILLCLTPENLHVHPGGPEPIATSGGLGYWVCGIC